MKICVCIRQVPDTETKIKVNSEKDGIDTSGIKWIMNPYDEFAVEEALKVKESQSNVSVTALSVGPKSRVTDTIRTALAMGADDGILIDTTEKLDNLTVAKMIAKAVTDTAGPYDLILTGKLAIDDNMGCVGQMVAELLKWPHASVVSKFELQDSIAIADSDLEGGGKRRVRMRLPALVTANKGLNSPRYASLPGIMKAKKKPIKELSASDLGITVENQVNFKDFQMPLDKAPVKMIEGEPQEQALELVRLLREEAKVL